MEKNALDNQSPQEGMPQLMADAGIMMLGNTLIPQLSTLFS
jgi:hypothetical protein